MLSTHHSRSHRPQSSRLLRRCQLRLQSWWRYLSSTYLNSAPAATSALESGLDGESTQRHSQQHHRPTNGLSRTKLLLLLVLLLLNVFLLWQWRHGYLTLESALESERAELAETRLFVEAELDRERAELERRVAALIAEDRRRAALHSDGVKRLISSSSTIGGGGTGTGTGTSGESALQRRMRRRVDQREAGLASDAAHANPAAERAAATMAAGELGVGLGRLLEADGGHETHAYGLPQLIVAVGTVARVDERGRPKGYLQRTVESVIQQLDRLGESLEVQRRAESPPTQSGVSTAFPAALDAGVGEVPAAVRYALPVRMVVMNHVPGAHEEFEQLRNKYAQHPGAEFVENQDRLLDPYDRMPIPDDFNNPDDVPGPRVRQQTCDVIRLLEHCQERSRYLVLIEDDFPACEGTLAALQYVIRKATAYRRHWRGVRTSFGANGIILPNLGARLSPLIEYARDQIARRPIDHILTQWMCGNSLQQPRCSPVRENFAFRWNLFEHIGFQSSLRETGVAVDVTPRCWEPYGDLLWSVDGYNELECPYDDMWPCFGKGITAIGDHLDLLEVDKFAFHNYWIRVALEGNTLDVTLQKRTVPLLFSFEAPESAAASRLSTPASRVHSFFYFFSFGSSSSSSSIGSGAFFSLIYPLILALLVGVVSL